MINKFKFGDRVKRKSDGAVGIVAGISFKSVLVFFDGAAVSSFYDADDFEIVPHPDTVRLDWLAENDCALTKRLCNEDGDIHPTPPNAVIQKQEEHFEVLVATSNDIREAIDVAMAHIESKR